MLNRWLVFLKMFGLNIKQEITLCLPLDGTAGGSNKYDVYIGNLGSGLYGFVSPENLIGNNPQSSSLTEVDAMTSWMGMNNSYSWASLLSVLNAIKVTAAHEFFILFSIWDHIFQY